MIRFVSVLLMAFGLLQGQSPHELSITARAGDKAALQALVAMGSSGNLEADYWLGMMHQLGAGVAKDSATAVSWYRKAAERGYAPAQSNLGWMYEKGEGVSKNPATAVTWYRRAADQGNEDAEFSLGAAYEFGSGVLKDAATALQWYRRAAEQGLASAQYVLGLAYEEGAGVPKNLVIAYMWLDLAAAEGDEQMRGARDYAAGQMTPAQIAEARALSSGHGARAAELPKINAVVTPPKTALQADSGPTLKETLDWLKEKLPLGVVAWTQAGKDGTRGTVNHQTQAWSFNSCTLAVGYAETVIFDIPPLPPSKFIITDRYTLALGDLTSAVVLKVDNPQPEYRFLSGDQSSYAVFMVTSSSFVHMISSNDQNLAPRSERVDNFSLRFNDEGLANRVKDAFKHAADLCRKKEAF